MNKFPQDTAWKQEWDQHLTDRDETFEEERALIKPDAKSSYQQNGPASQHLTSAMPDPAAMLIRQIQDSIEYDGIATHEESSRHLAGATAEKRDQMIRLKAGEIIQLDPSINSEWGRPVYVLILTMSEFSVKAVPFSPLDIPATDGELLTHFGEPGFEVLSAWNISNLPIGLFTRHFKLDTAGDDIISDLNALLAALQKREDIPSHLTNRVGPSRFQLSPEKQDYLDREESLFSELISF